MINSKKANVTYLARNRQVNAAASCPSRQARHGQTPRQSLGQNRAQKAHAKTNNWISRAMQNYVGSAGDYAGGLVHVVGDSINKLGMSIGTSITNNTRAWGQGVASYGNNLKDVVGAGGSRVATSSNPLGLAGKAGTLSGATSTSGKSTRGNPLGL